MNSNFKNILILSVAFMLKVSAYFTMSGIEQPMIKSIQIEDPTFVGDGFVSLAIINGGFAISSFIAPFIVAMIGARMTMSVGSMFYTLFIAGFLYPNVWYLYATSAMLGFSTACVWVANGVYMTQCCTKENIGRNTGIHWVVLNSGVLLGNSLVYWQFLGKKHIDADTRFVVIIVLAIVCIVATLTLLLLGKPSGCLKVNPEKNLLATNISVMLSKPFLILRNKHMLLLIFPSMYLGMQTAFFSGIYPTSVGFTEELDDSKKLIGLSGISTGIGTLVGGLVLGVYADKVVQGRRYMAFLLAFAIHLVTLILIYINIPNSAPWSPTHDTSWLNPPSTILSLVCAFMLGICNGCLSPQVCSVIGIVWPEDPSATFAIFRFFLASTCAVGIYCGTLTGLHSILIIFGSIAFLAAISFCCNEVLLIKLGNNKHEENSR